MNGCATFESLARRLCREVWIVTASAAGQRGGLLATWFGVASLDAANPLVVTALAPCHFTCELVAASGAFSAHLLRPNQWETAAHFALRSGREFDKLANLPHTTGATGSPRLTDCLAWLDCRVVHRLDAGDRIYFWAVPELCGELGSEPPLVDRDLFAHLSEGQRNTLQANLNDDLKTLAAMRTNSWHVR